MRLSGKLGGGWAVVGTAGMRSKAKMVKIRNRDFIGSLLGLAPLGGANLSLIVKEQEKEWWVNILAEMRVG